MSDTSSKPKVLIVDDETINIQFIGNVLRDYADVIFATNGKDALMIAKANRPDIILLDIVMPDMDGYEVCKKLKEDGLTKHIPIILITAIKTDSESRAMGLNMGADAFLWKPIDALELVAQINVMLRIKKAEDKIRREKEHLEEKNQELERYALLFEGREFRIKELRDKIKELETKLQNLS